MAKLKTGDKVMVISGSEKGKSGKISAIEGDRVVIEGINIRTKHKKATATDKQSGIFKEPQPIHRSKVAIMSGDNKVSKVGFKLDKGKKTRVYRSNKREIK